MLESEPAGAIEPADVWHGEKTYHLTAVSSHSNLMTQITEYKSARKPAVESQLEKPMCSQIAKKCLNGARAPQDRHGPCWGANSAQAL